MCLGRCTTSISGCKDFCRQAFQLNSFHQGFKVQIDLSASVISISTLASINNPSPINLEEKCKVHGSKPLIQFFKFTSHPFPAKRRLLPWRPIPWPFLPSCTKKKDLVEAEGRDGSDLSPWASRACRKVGCNPNSHGNMAIRTGTNREIQFLLLTMFFFRLSLNLGA